MKTIFLFAAVMGIFSSPVFAEAVPSTPSTERTTMSAEQQRWLGATHADRLKIAEDIGEEGARAWARQQGYKPLLDRGQKTFRHGFDQVYRAPNGDIVVVEAKGGTSSVNRGYGHIQGTPEHAIESAKRILRSPKTTPAEKRAALEILEAAAKGQLRTVVVRTPHVLGKALAPLLEKAYETSDTARRLAQEALEELRRGGTGAPTAKTQPSKRPSDGKAHPKKPSSLVELAEQPLEVAAKSGKGAERALRVAGRSLVVVGAAVEGVHRVNEARATESAYDNGLITQGDRLVRHAENLAGCAGGVAGAAVGAKAGGVTGAAVGSFVGPVGTAVGGFVGALGGGVAGYFGGEWAGEETAEAGVHAFVP